MDQTQVDAAPTPKRTYRYYDLVMAAFVTILLCSNLIGAGKVAEIGGFSFGAGILFFPISYILGDIMTEVYGYARARKIVWAGFGALIFASLMSWVILALPASPNWGNQAAYENVFGATPRIAISSLIAFWMGEFTNSFTLAKMKILTQGKALWTRTIGSTVLGEAVDSIVFYPLAFWGVWDTKTVFVVMGTNYCLKVLWEVINTPVTYAIIKFLKKAENEDFYDKGTNFTPFSLKT